MSLIEVIAGPYTFKAKFEEEAAPKTCAKVPLPAAVQGADHSCPLDRRRLLDSAG